MTLSENRRVLIIDDNPSIHDDFRKILGAAGILNPSLRAKESLLFGEADEPQVPEGFELAVAFQGDEGLERIVEARREGQPFTVAFVDIRMPPGMDGIETIARAWDADPDIQFVICSAYSDYTARDILARLGVSDRLLLLRKPCDSAEILLIASALSRKWNLNHLAHAC